MTMTKGRLEEDVIHDITFDSTVTLEPGFRAWFQPRDRRWISLGLSIEHIKRMKCARGGYSSKTRQSMYMVFVFAALAVVIFVNVMMYSGDLVNALSFAVPVALSACVLVIVSVIMVRESNHVLAAETQDANTLFEERYMAPVSVFSEPIKSAINELEAAINLAWKLRECCFVEGFDVPAFNDEVRAFQQAIRSSLVGNAQRPANLSRELVKRYASVTEPQVGPVEPKAWILHHRNAMQMVKAHPGLTEYANKVMLTGLGISGLDAGIAAFNDVIDHSAHDAVASS